MFIAFLLILYYLQHSFINYLTRFHPVFIVVVGMAGWARLVA
ncbi:MAG: hypothetical protein QNJ63_23605 [Calothrix sp. MO_192.B10]|nr:hypothetical protein [Calothrix sp. MO_192.B10]